MKTFFLRRCKALILAAGCSVPFLYGAGLRERVDLAKVEIPFERNQGQAGSSALFLARGRGYSMVLEESGTVLHVPEPGVPVRPSVESVRFRWIEGGKAVVQGEGLTGGHSSYFTRNDASATRTGIPHFGSVRYRGLYPGVDALYYSHGGKVEYDLIVAPGADAGQIRFRVEGAKSVRIHDDNLVIRTKFGDIRHQRPVVFQEVAGVRKKVEGKYRLLRDGVVGFTMGPYDPSQTLVIDPVLSYSLYAGGSLIDSADAIAVDLTGAAYIAGQTLSTDFPVVGGTGAVFGGQLDAFVYKLNPAGTQIVYSTFIGGSASDAAHGIAVDPAGAAFVTGETNSTNFPTTAALRRTLNGPVDAFLFKLSPAGNQLSWSTYIGGSQQDFGTGVALDAAGNAYMTGRTMSGDLPGVAAGQVLQGTTDAFVTAVSAAGTSFLFATYVGGNLVDTGSGIAVAGQTVYVAGRTSSTSRGTLLGGEDAFIARVSTAGALQSWAYLGGSGVDFATGVATDSAGEVYITGVTSSTNFPLLNPAQSAYGGGATDGFVTKVNGAADTLRYSTYLGGNNEDQTTSIAVDASKAALVAGFTLSATFPVVSTLKASDPANYDAFITRIAPAGNSFLYSTLFGGSAADRATSVAVDASGSAFFTGLTLSSNFPQSIPGSLRSQDAFLVKLSSPCTFGLTPNPITFSAAGGVQNVTVTSTGAECGWLAVPDSAFLTALPNSGVNAGTVAVTAQANGGIARTGYIQIGGVLLPVQQAPGTPSNGCAVTLTPPTLAVPPQGATSTFQISTNPAGCAWNATPNVPWAQVFPPSGSGTTTVSFTIYPNFSNQGRAGAFSVNTQAVTISQTAPALTEPQRFITLVYFFFLGRYPAQAEIDFQVGALNAGTPRAQIIDNFFNAPEFNAGGRFTAGLYAGLLNRDPEYNGWLFQRNALATGFATQTQLVTNFLNSQEFILTNGNLSNDAFVTLLYSQVLGRQPAPSELAFQSGALASGVSRTTLATNFLTAQEFQIRVSGRLTSFLLYATLLGRNPTTAEFQQRQGQLTAGVPVSTIAADIVNLPEFSIRLQ